MRKIEQVSKATPTITEVTCDRCTIVVKADDIMEFQEFLSLTYDAGYGNREFNDGDELEIDLCQHCVKVVLGPYLRLVRNPISHFGYKNE